MLHKAARVICVLPIAKQLLSLLTLLMDALAHQVVNVLQAIATLNSSVFQRALCNMEIHSSLMVVSAPPAQNVNQEHVQAILVHPTVPHKLKVNT